MRRICGNSENMSRFSSFFLLVGLMTSAAAQAADPLGEDQLMADIKRYESFGVHRYGSAGAEAALDWIADELKKAGLAVNTQPFFLDKQYEVRSASLTAGNKRIDVLPQWWIPEAQARFSLTAAIASSANKATQAVGQFVRLDVPYDRGAYLNQNHVTRLDEAFARNPAAVLLTIDHPSGEIFTYNVDQSAKPWPVPVILVAPKDRAVLAEAERTGAKVTVDVSGIYKQAVEGQNIVARLDRNRNKWLVISTPVTSWFTSTCERGPGIAGFLAMARIAAQRFPDHDLVFVATAGHEIGHGGMSYFMRRGAPSPRDVVAWAHFGASLACRQPLVQVVLVSETMAPLVERTFAGIPGTRLVGEKAAVGEMRDVQSNGFPNFFGMAGAHKYFHTPADNSAEVDPAQLVKVVKAFADTLGEASKSAR